MAKKSRKETFEAALGRLEEIAQRLERGEMPLDEALKQYEEGVKAYRYCLSLLEEIEKKIEMLTGEVGRGIEEEEATDLDTAG